VLSLQDNSGFITADEVHRILGGSLESGGLNIPDADINRLIKEVDFNNDNKIDYSEFLEMMKRDLKGEAAEEAVKKQGLETAALSKKL
jgi:Ca2+-binding EF-hand superfamily protein